ncbi:MAG: hypothetical protein HKN20_11920 [Gemmatimonadetes bacterium]|nr:hypothetical protein [Gemmatimonadota bacterium]
MSGYVLADQPSVLGGGSSATIWEGETTELRYLVRSNRNQPGSFRYTINGPSMTAAGYVDVDAQDQTSISIQTPVLSLGDHDYQITLIDTAASPDSTLWMATSTVFVVDYTTSPAIEPVFDPEVLSSPFSLTYPPLPKPTVLRIPKSPDKSQVTISWWVRITNVNPNNAGKIFEALPDSGRVSGSSGEEVTASVDIFNSNAVPFGEINRFELIVIAPSGDTLGIAGSAIATDSLGTPSVTSTEESSWSELKSLFR